MKNLCTCLKIASLFINLFYQRGSSFPEGPLPQVPLISHWLDLGVTPAPSKGLSQLPRDLNP